MTQINETIYALASAAGRAGVSVLRISGPKSHKVIEQLAGGCVKPRQAALRLLRDPVSHEPIDKVLLLWFPAPNSFTGEDIVEIQAHGSQAVVEKLLSVLSAFEDFRLAEPGEFARRAFENGKLDLTAIEGLADLINAQTEGQRRQALRQSEGQLGDLYEDWRHKVLSASALMEALIDFSDEEDIDDALGRKARTIITDLLSSISDHLEISGKRGEQMRDGFRLVIAGAPNVGKSSLLNVLANREAAIVTSEPGTTRDVIEVQLTIGDFPVLVMDTAGIRQTDGLVEAEGIKRAMDRLDSADLILWLLDGTTCPKDDRFLRTRIAEHDSCEVWRILSKADLPENSAKILDDQYDLRLSAHTGEGIPQLIDKLTQHLQSDESHYDSPLITRVRHRQEVVAAQLALSDYLASSHTEPELRAEDLRQATKALGRLTGRIDVEELLGHIFGEFCIGK